MERYLPIAYKSKSYPHSPTLVLYINTSTWKIGFAHFTDWASMTINTEIQFLCFGLRWRTFIEDIQMKKGKQK